MRAGGSQAHADDVEALLTTVAAVVVISLGLLLLARLWPHSSRRTGYRISGQDRAGDEAPSVPEDDDARWRWKGQ